jgi:Cu/Zn superoxide dismutase
MFYDKLTLILVLLCATAVFGQGAVKSAQANITNAQGQTIGTAKIVAAKQGVKIEVNVSQLPPASTAFTFTMSANAKGRISPALART